MKFVNEKMKKNNEKKDYFFSLERTIMDSGLFFRKSVFSRSAYYFDFSIKNHLHVSQIYDILKKTNLQTSSRLRKGG